MLSEREQVMDTLLSMRLQHARDALPSMLELLETSADPDTQVSVLQAFETMPDISMLPALTTILQKDTDNTQIRLLSYSCDIVGDIALERPSALSDETLDALVVSAFKVNAVGQNLWWECGRAIRKLGAPASRGGWSRCGSTS